MSILLAKNPIKKSLIYYAIAGILLILFDIVYEQFSHGLHSNSMRFSFLIPWIGGPLIHTIFYLFHVYHDQVIKIWNMGLTTLVFGFTFTGIFEIYGSSEPLVISFYILGGFVCLLSIIFYIYILLKKDKSSLN